MSPPIPTVVVLAAGLGTRMKSATPKVLHRVCGLPLVIHVLRAAQAVQPERVVVVLGKGHEEVRPYLPEGCAVALQEAQRGTGDALLAAAAHLDEGPVLVLPGDTPLITAETLLALAGTHVAVGAEATVLTMELAEPGAYGRVVRDADGLVARIVEARDATPEVLAVNEVNAGMYILPGRRSVELLRRVGTDNEQGEVYLTDVIAALRSEGARVAACRAGDPGVTLGVNSRVELAEAQELMRGRLCREWMLAGVTIEDPASVHLDATVVLEPDVTILPFTCLRGVTRVARGSEVGPGCTLIDTVVGEGCRVRQAYAEGAVLDAGVTVGPFTYLRPGAQLREGAKAGAFVEIKKSTVGRGSKVPHLSYIGDTIIGEGTNIGAGCITANYDGYHKHPTVIGDNVKTGSDTVFVAPVTVGDGAITGAGSVITRDVPAGALGIARSRQQNLGGYAERQAAAHDETPTGDKVEDGPHA